MRGELRVRYLDGQHRRQAFTGVVTTGSKLVFLSGKFFFDIAVQRTGQRAAKPGHMGSAITLWDVVGVTEHILLIAVIPLQSSLNDNTVFLVLKVKHGTVDQRLVLVEVIHKGPYTALILENIVLFVALVDQLDAHT